jgi:fatty-acyl-CoA synthase
VVVLKPGQEANEHKLVEHVKSYVDRGMLPREAVLLRAVFADSIEKTSVGKVDKLALRKRYASA